MAASLMGVNATIKSFPAALSLSTSTCKAFSLSTNCKALSLSSSSEVEQKKWFDKVNKMVDGFDKESMKAKEMNEYDTKLEKLLDKSEYDAVLLNELKILQASFVEAIEKRKKAFDFVEQVKQLLYWFENETIKAKEIIDKLRKEYHIIINSEEKTVLFADLEVMFWYLSVKQAKAIRTKIKAGYRSERPLTNLYLELYRKWKVEDAIVGVNQLLDWFDKEIMEAKGITQILRIKSEIIALKIFKEWEDVDVLFEDSKDMFWNLKKKQAKAILAKSKAANFTHEVPKVAKLLYPLLLL